MIPNFLCIGSQKAGTSWVYNMLKQHPDVWLPEIKEIHFFDYHYGQNTGTKVWGQGFIRKAMNRLENKKNISNVDKAYIQALKMMPVFSNEWYEMLFNHPDAYGAKAIGEITPAYSSISEKGISEINNFLNSPKIIWIIRDPVKRAESQIKMEISRRNLDVKDIDWDSFLGKFNFNNRGDYKKYIPMWSECSDSDILYLPYGDIKNNSKEFMERIEDHLHIESFSYSGLNDRVHETKKVELPEFITSMLFDNFSHQSSYLKNKFGEDFMERIK